MMFLVDLQCIFPIGIVHLQNKILKIHNRCHCKPHSEKYGTENLSSSAALKYLQDKLCVSKKHCISMCSFAEHTDIDILKNVCQRTQHRAV